VIIIHPPISVYYIENNIRLSRQNGDAGRKGGERREK
jgi:hypothetical protein